MAILPDKAANWMSDAVRSGGGSLVPVDEAAALVWNGGDASTLAGVLAAYPDIRWVQLGSTGVDQYVSLMSGGRTWTCARDVFGESVAEHALALALAGLHQLSHAAQMRSWWTAQLSTLSGARVAIVGGGAIGKALLALLKPFRVRPTVVRRSGRPLTGARVVGPGHLLEAVRGARVVFLAVPLTRDTQGMIGAAELRVMGPSSWLVNVARGKLVVTGDLVRALKEGWIAGAALDVTDPEPLPNGNPLWQLDNCLITPHAASAEELSWEPMAALVKDNVRRFNEGVALKGLVDLELGY